MAGTYIYNDTTKAAVDQDTAFSGAKAEELNPGFVVTQPADGAGTFRKHAAVASISVSPATMNLSLGASAKGQCAVTATLTVAALGDHPAVSGTKDVTAAATYTSSDATKATVDTAGKVTPVATGTATITATYQTKTDTVAVTVVA